MVLNFKFKNKICLAQMCDFYYIRKNKNNHMKGRIFKIISICVIFHIGHAEMRGNETEDYQRSTPTRKAVVGNIKRNIPRLAADTAMTASQIEKWRGEMSETMAKLMAHPSRQMCPPVRLSSAQRDGYRIERWQSFPLPETRVNFLVLIPDGVDENNPAVGGVLCIPGFGQTKELLAGEKRGDYDLVTGPDSVTPRAAMAKLYVEKGLVAVAVDNPSFGELSDNGVGDYLNTSRMLLEENWSYLGLTSWQDKIILDWLKQQPFINQDKLIVSGFSLGTEPMMVLGLLDNDIEAFVYNDFLCRTRERILVMDKPDEKGNRPFPNSIEHLIPGFLMEFDFPDIVAALSPRPVICTEGGLDRDFHIIEKIYENAGAPENFEYHHYEKYADPAERIMIGKDELPGNLDLWEFFRLVNVDSPNHYFKAEFVMPWLDRFLSE